MLRDLPAPVQRYLRHAGVVGQPRVHTVRLKQAGRFRTGPDRAWMDFRAQQYYTVEPPGFLWDATFYIAGLPLMRVRDRHLNGAGNIRVTVAGLFTVADAAGKALDQGTMLRFLNEMMWFPSAFLGDNVGFAPVDDQSAKVTFSDHGKRVTATIYFDEEGRLLNFVAERYYEAGDRYLPWSTPMSEYGEFHGRQVPVRGEGVWKLAEGDFAYIDPVISELEYDVPKAY